jgi:hypothetical protein
MDDTETHPTLDEEASWEGDPKDVWVEFLEPVKRMSRDMKLAAATLGDREARHLVDSYYIMQEDRKRAAGQQRALTSSGEPHSVINWIYNQSSTLENQIKSALDVYSESHVMGSWMRQITGIGPVLSAGLLAHIYMGEWCSVCHAHDAEKCVKLQEKDKNKTIEKHDFIPEYSCPTVGHIWSFAGWASDGQKVWEKGEKRPFNAKFRVLCWKAGQSFLKLSNNPKCFYGVEYRKRKEYEIARNERGDLAAQAALGAARVDKYTDAYKYYIQGKLPPAHIDARARRWAVKLFLAHLHGEWYERNTGKPAPAPYPITHLGHVHIIPSPVKKKA